MTLWFTRNDVIPKKNIINGIRLSNFLLLNNGFASKCLEQIFIFYFPCQVQKHNLNIKLCAGGNYFNLKKKLPFEIC